VPLWVVRVIPVTVRAKLSTCRIIWFTISVFSATGEIGTERGQGMGAHPLHQGAYPVSGPSVGPLPRACFYMCDPKTSD